MLLLTRLEVGYCGPEDLFRAIGLLRDVSCRGMMGA